MSTQGRVKYIVVVIGAICFYSMTTLAAAQSSLNILGPSSYSAKQIQIKEAILTGGGKVKIAFRTMAETLWYCPGANGKTTKDGIELTFVRTRIQVKPKVTYAASPDDRGAQSIVVDAKGNPLFLRSGTTLVRLFPRQGNDGAKATMRTYAVFKRGQSANVRLVYSGGTEKWDAGFAVHTDGTLHTVNAATITLTDGKGNTMAPREGKVVSLWMNMLATRPFDVTVDLARLYDLSSVGEYTVEWGCRSIRTQAIRVQVVE